MQSAIDESLRSLVLPAHATIHASDEGHGDIAVAIHGDHSACAIVRHKIAHHELQLRLGRASLRRNADVQRFRSPAVQRMNISPCPVAETAQVALSANVPAPITGVSPTRPGGLAVMPPVEVAAARLPRQVQRHGAHRAVSTGGVGFICACLAQRQRFLQRRSSAPR